MGGRNYAQLNLQWWSDESWRGLTPSAQHLYMVLISHASTSYAGVTDWRPNRLAVLAKGWTREDIYRGALELSDALRVVIDEETEEILIRRWAVDQGVMKQNQLAVALTTAVGKVASDTLRGVIIDDLHTHMREAPELGCWKDHRMLSLLEQTRVRAEDLDPDAWIPAGVMPGVLPGVPSGVDDPQSDPVQSGVPNT